MQMNDKKSEHFPQKNLPKEKKNAEAKLRYIIDYLKK